jgi:hypothetical protein
MSTIIEIGLEQTIGEVTIQETIAEVTIDSSVTINQSNISDEDATDLTDGGQTNLHAHTESIGIAISSFETDIESNPSVAYFDVPYNFYLTDVYGTLKVAPVGSNAIFDINEAGVSILGNKIVIEQNEFSSKTAVTQPTITDANLAANARLTFDIDQVGSSTAGQEGVIFLVGYKT